MNEPEENDFIRQTLRQVMPDDLPPTVAERMQNQLATFRRKLDAEPATPRFSPIRRLLQKRLIRWATAAITTAALVVAILLVPQAWRPVESAAWAQVVEAVAKKPWLHAMCTAKGGPKPGTKCEMWFSANRAVEAFKFGEIGWIDFGQKTIDIYHPDRNAVIRMAGVDWGSVEAHEAIFRAFLSADVGRTIGAGRLKLVHQQERVVTGGNKRWIEHRFQRQPVDGTAAVESETVVYVDPDTQLPFRFDQISRTKGSEPPKVDVLRSDVDYPDAGPADIYTLGVPKTAKMLAPVKADVKQLVAEVYSSRWHSERCQALIVESWEKDHWSQGHGVYRMWRSGACWKVDRSWGYTTRPTDKLPSKGIDPAAWWQEHVAKVRFVPYKLCDGDAVWEYNRKSRAPTPADIAAGAPADAAVLLSTEKRLSGRVVPGNFTDMEDYSSQGRPYFPIFGPPYYDTTVDPMPKSGPPNTVLLEFRNAGWKPGETFPPQIWRYWIDPVRSYLVMREEQIITVNGKEKITTGSVIEGVTQDHKGQWYPTVIRMLNTVHSMHSDKTSDQILRFYYDFTTPIPESVFTAD